MHLGHGVKAVAVLAALIVTAACSDGGGAKPSGDPAPSGSAAATGAADGPEPDAVPTWVGTGGQEIRLGPRRYVSPCQVLTAADVEHVVGGFTPRDHVVEDYVDTSKPADGRTYQTRCEYVLAPGVFARQLKVEADQIAARPRADDPAFSWHFVDKRQLKPVIARLERVITADPARELVARMRASLRLLPGGPGGTLTDEQAETLVLPDLGTASGVRVVHDGTFWDVVLIAGNVYDFEDLTDDDLRARFDLLTAAVERVEEHLADPALSQEPGPTYLTPATHRGSTPVLDACAVLTDAAYRKILHGTPNLTVKRTSTPYDIQGSPLARDGKVMLPQNGCARSYDDEVDPLGESRTTTIDISISYAADVRELRRNGYLKNLPGSRALRTRADRARLSLVLGSPSFTFRVGPYWVFLTMDRLESDAGIGDIDTVQGTVRDHVRAINVLSDALRAAVDRSTTLLAD